MWEENGLIQNFALQIAMEHSSFSAWMEYRRDGIFE